MIIGVHRYTSWWYLMIVFLFLKNNLCYIILVEKCYFNSKTWLHMFMLDTMRTVYICNCRMVSLDSNSKPFWIRQSCGYKFRFETTVICYILLQCVLENHHVSSVKSNQPWAMAWLCKKSLYRSQTWQELFLLVVQDQTVQAETGKRRTAKHIWNPLVMAWACMKI